METPITLENDVRIADHRHPVDFIEPLPNSEDSLERICTVLARTFGWVAEGPTIELKGLRASVVLYCVRADLIGNSTLEELSSEAGFPGTDVENLVADFCRAVGWK